VGFRSSCLGFLQLLSCHSSGEMRPGKCKFSMGDVIRELKSGAKNGHISWTNAIWTSKFRLSQWNLFPFRLTPLPTHSVMGRESPIETIVNTQWDSPQALREIPVDETFRPPFPSISRRRVHQQSCHRSYGHKKQDLSIDTNFEQFCENRIDPIQFFQTFIILIKNFPLKKLTRHHYNRDH